MPTSVNTPRLAGKPTVRLAWPDAAKGLSILGVVLLHACLAVPGGMETLPAEVNHLLDPLRIPLFFLVSGFFSVKVLSFSFVEVWTRRVWFFLLPYVVWAPVELYVSGSIQRHFGVVDPADIPSVIAAVGGESYYWFLYCLALFCVAAWATRRLRPSRAVALSFLPLLFVFLPDSVPSIIWHIALYFPVYMIGVRYRPTIAALAAVCKKPAVWFLVVVSTCVTVAGYNWAMHRIFSLPETVWGDATRLGLTRADLEFLVGAGYRLLMIPTGVLLAVALAAVPGVFHALAFFGRHTLCIYIGHALSLVLFFSIPFVYPSTPHGLTVVDGRAVHATVWVLLAVALSLVGSGLFFLAERLPLLGWTLAPPPIYQYTAQRSTVNVDMPTSTDADAQVSATSTRTASGTATAGIPAQSPAEVYCPHSTQTPA